MNTNNTSKTIETIVNAPTEKVWCCWTEPEHIKKWNNASEDWHTPKAENNLQVGGKFLLRMEAKDGSMGFDFFGFYTDVQINKHIAYTLEDDRKVEIFFIEEGNQTKVVETFETENINSTELQRAGWQAILNNFKKYTEAYSD